MATFGTIRIGVGGRRGAAWFALAALIALAACKPAQTVEYYRKNTIARDKMVNLCLASNSDSWDCVNAIEAEAERWGNKDIDGFSVVISGDATPPPKTP